MGIKIDLPIYTLEEAALLDETLLQRIQLLQSLATLEHSTSEERRVFNEKARKLTNLRNRFLSTTEN